MTIEAHSIALIVKMQAVVGAFVSWNNPASHLVLNLGEFGFWKMLSSRLIAETGFPDTRAQYCATNCTRPGRASVGGSLQKRPVVNTWHECYLAKRF